MWLQRMQTPTLALGLQAFSCLNCLLNFPMTLSLVPIKSSKGFPSITVAPENIGACGHQVIRGLGCEDNWVSLAMAWGVHPFFFSSLPHFNQNADSRCRVWKGSTPFLPLVASVEGVSCWAHPPTHPAHVRQLHSVSHAFRSDTR